MNDHERGKMLCGIFVIGFHYRWEIVSYNFEGEGPCFYFTLDVT